MSEKRDPNILYVFFDLGMKSGMPRYTAILGLLQSSILFVPEHLWTSLGIDALQYISIAPAFVQYYVNSADFKNAMLMFWVLSPITFFGCAVLFSVHINNRQGYAAYIDRKDVRLRSLKRTSDYSLAMGAMAIILFYVWSTAIYLVEPKLFGSLVPTKSRFSMLLIHASAVSLILPGCIAILIAETRVALTTRTIFGGK